MIKNIIVVGSGKGGVGKSTIALNLSISLAQKTKKKIGLLDADIYGPSIPKLLDIKNKPQISENKKIIPYQKYGIKVMSIGNMIPNDNAIIWRGVMASRAIKQLVQDVDWGELDFLFIDLPPGTGDIQLSLCQNLSLTGSIIVSTPQEVSLIDVRKAVNMFNKVNVPILGFIQNMSYFKIKSQKNYIFGKDGVIKEAKKQNYNFLGEIPIFPEIAKESDLGIPPSKDSKSEIGKIFSNINNKLLDVLLKSDKVDVKVEN